MERKRNEVFKEIHTSRLDTLNKIISQSVWVNWVKFQKHTRTSARQTQHRQEQLRFHAISRSESSSPVK